MGSTDGCYACRTIELSYIVYNPNFRAVALVRHDFKMDFTGRLFGSLRVTTLPYDCYATWQQHIRGVLEVPIQLLLLPLLIDRSGGVCGAELFNVQPMAEVYPLDLPQPM